MTAMLARLRWTAAVAGLLLAASAARGQATSGVIERGGFRFAHDERGISLIANAHDPYGATLTPPGAAARRARGGQAAPGQTLGLTVAYRAGSATTWTTVSARAPGGSSATRVTVSPASGSISYVTGATGAPLA